MNQIAAKMPYGGGYWCPTCNTWVSGPHNCSPRVWTTHQTVTVLPNLGSSPVPQISKFKGAIDTLEDLPSKPAVGDAYYVIQSDLLVVRQSNGWFHYDR